MFFFIPLNHFEGQIGVRVPLKIALIIKVISRIFLDINLFFDAKVTPIVKSPKRFLHKAWICLIKGINQHRVHEEVEYVKKFTQPEHFNLQRVESEHQHAYKDIVSVVKIDLIILQNF